MVPRRRRGRLAGRALSHPLSCAVKIAAVLRGTTLGTGLARTGTNTGTPREPFERSREKGSAGVSVVAERGRGDGDEAQRMTAGRQGRERKNDESGTTARSGMKVGGERLRFLSPGCQAVRCCQVICRAVGHCQALSGARSGASVRPAVRCCQCCRVLSGACLTVERGAL